MSEAVNITADAVALQERDEFQAAGWIKLVAPAKVNLHLAIGAKRPDGYHDAATVLHAVNLHDVVYMRRKAPGQQDPDAPAVRMVSVGDVAAPDLASRDNIAAKAVEALVREAGLPGGGVDIRIEKNIPAQGGLGGGSSDAAAAIVGAAELFGLAPDDEALYRAARSVGSDVAFFLKGGCAYYEGTGDAFVRALVPSKQAVALLKPDAGVSTAEAYRAFDAAPVAVPDENVKGVARARRAEDVVLFNNLAPAAEGLLGQLAEIRTWACGLPGVQSALLCGSGSTTFAVCDDFAAACGVVAEARTRGLWARTTSFGSIRAMVVST